MQSPLVTARVLWAAILSSVGIFFAMHQLAEHPTQPQDPALYPLFGFFALSVAVASFLVPPRLHLEMARALRLETRDVPNVVRPDAPNATQRTFAEPEKARAAAWRLFMTPFIITLALSEAVGLAGLALGFLGFPDARVVPFFAASLLLLALRFPRANSAEKQLEKSLGATF